MEDQSWLEQQVEGLVEQVWQEEQYAAVVAGRHCCSWPGNSGPDGVPCSPRPFHNRSRCVLPLLLAVLQQCLGVDPPQPFYAPPWGKKTNLSNFFTKNKAIFDYLQCLTRLLLLEKLLSHMGQGGRAATAASDCSLRFLQRSSSCSCLARVLLSVALTGGVPGLVGVAILSTTTLTCFILASISSLCLRSSSSSSSFMSEKVRIRPCKIIY